MNFGDENQPDVRRVFRPSDLQKSLSIFGIPIGTDAIGVFNFLESVIQKGSITMFDRKITNSGTQGVYLAEVATMDQAKILLNSSAKGELVFNGHVLQCRQYTVDKSDK